MIKSLSAACAMAATAALTLSAAPASADTWTDNWSRNLDSSQSGNTFGDVGASNRGWGRSTNVNNVNGVATTATQGSTVITYVFY
ncbi:hypothetical protein HTZ77_36350 [Nonomuraea sp. SMC257]|uniref:Uncharacterized protein n=1 Tax=Nonomuraea montanisoli TaxID=2741721 RepID=A0A7Y6IEJ9_9ACTN|nr:hypothetical protein [Nonomuraea montanisoli]NUW36840.1 hypothetical protein [Nonomuraea montanisoli]